MISVPDESINKETISHKDAINPELFYKKSQLSYCKDTDGRSVYGFILKKERAGLISFIPHINRVGNRAHKSHLWYGQDILNVLSIRDRDKKEPGLTINPADPTQSIISKIVKVSSKKDIVNIVEQSINLQKENSLLQEYIKKIQTQLYELSEQNKKISHELAIRENLTRRITTEIIEFITNNEKEVYWFKLSLEQACGVYLLKHNESVVYVGQSVSIPNRIIQHAKDGKVFDKVVIVPCPPEDLDEKEMFLIRLLKPPLNGQYKNTTDLKIIEYEYQLDKQIKKTAA
jgi:hypothetical protein